MRLQLTAVALTVLAACGDEAPPVEPVDAPAVDAPAIDAPVDAVPIDAPRLCDSEMRDDDYVAGMRKVGPNGFTVVLVESTPAPIRIGDYAWDVQVLDPDGLPRDGLEIRVRPYMPDHQHGTSVMAAVTPGGGGAYAISPINLFMSGFWATRLTLRSGDADVDVVTYNFCVDFG